jgi:hypothetical protein
MKEWEKVVSGSREKERKAKEKEDEQVAAKRFKHWQNRNKEWAKQREWIIDPQTPRRRYTLALANLPRRTCTNAECQSWIAEVFKGSYIPYTPFSITDTLSDDVKKSKGNGSDMYWMSEEEWRNRLWVKYNHTGTYGDSYQTSMPRFGGAAGS